MTPRCSKLTCRAMTLMDLVVIIFILGTLLLLLAAALVPRQNIHGAQRIHCINVLKQVGLAYWVWAGDNNDKFPMEVPVTNGGSMEWMNAPEAWRTYQVMSNYLSTPKVLYCPEDAVHGPAATNFGDGLKGRISYFIGRDASKKLPQSLLAGDDNFLIKNTPVMPGTVELTPNTAVGWDATRHFELEKDWWHARKGPRYGNICFSDGSVQSFRNPALTNVLSRTGLAVNRLAIP